MTEELSSLVDGELVADEAERAIRRCCGSEELKQKWRAYHLVGDALRGEGHCHAASTRRIIEALRNEPTVLAPRWRTRASAGRIAFAAAASLATLAVVGWIGIQDRGSVPRPALAKSAGTVSAPAPQLAANVVPLKNVNEYLVVHRQLPNAEFYQPVANQAAGAR